MKSILKRIQDSRVGRPLEIKKFNFVLIHDSLPKYPPQVIAQCNFFIPLLPKNSLPPLFKDTDFHSSWKDKWGRPREKVDL